MNSRTKVKFLASLLLVTPFLCLGTFSNASATQSNPWSYVVRSGRGAQQFCELHGGGDPAGCCVILATLSCSEAFGAGTQLYEECMEHFVNSCIFG